MRIICTVLLLLAAGDALSHSNQRAQECMALAIYWEARGEGMRGMQAVGSVIKNRARHRAFPDTVCEVVFQGGETPPCQFSWWCDGKSDRPRNLNAWRTAMRAAEQVLHGHPDPTRGALYFHSTQVKPKWRLQRVARIGQHVFYR